MADLDTLVGDLRAEGDDLDALVAHLTSEQWAAPTPAEGWTIAHQIAHLSWTDHVAERTTSAASGDTAAKEEFALTLKKAWENPTGFVDEAAEEEAHNP